MFCIKKKKRKKDARCAIVDNYILNMYAVLLYVYTRTYTNYRRVMKIITEIGGCCKVC